LTVYLDASALVPLFVEDVHTPAARRISQTAGPFVASAWTLAECSSAFARLWRTGTIDRAERDQLDRRLDAWAAAPSRLTSLVNDDLLLARACVRTSTMPLRAPDGLHLAVASRRGYALATFDAKLAEAAREMSLEVVDS
jgi:predicted nucleic acid-binding protein